MRQSIVTIQVSPENVPAVRRLMSLSTEGFIPDDLVELDHSEAMYTVALVGDRADHLLEQLAEQVRMGEIETMAEAKAGEDLQPDLPLSLDEPVAGRGDGFAVIYPEPAR